MRPEVRHLLLVQVGAKEALLVRLRVLDVVDHLPESRAPLEHDRVLVDGVSQELAQGLAHRVVAARLDLVLHALGLHELVSEDSAVDAVHFEDVALRERPPFCLRASTTCEYWNGQGTCEYWNGQGTVLQRTVLVRTPRSRVPS